MKKTILTLLFFFLITSYIMVNASYNYKVLENEIYKQAILSRDYLRDNPKLGKDFVKKIELYFDYVEANYNDETIENLEKLKVTTGTMLIKLRKKEHLSSNEKLVFQLAKNLFLRSIIELNK